MRQQNTFDDRVTDVDGIARALELGRVPEAPRVMPTQVLERSQGRLAAWIAQLTTGVGAART